MSDLAIEELEGHSQVREPAELNTLVKEGSALLPLGLPTTGRLAPAGRLSQQKALLSRGMVGATGFEPVTSSVSAKHREPLC